MNEKDFYTWKDALEFASTSMTPKSPASLSRTSTHGRYFSRARSQGEDDQEWSKVESLVTRIQDSRNAARTLAKDTDPKYLPFNSIKPPPDRTLESNPLSSASSASASPAEPSSNNSYFNERRSFWKRKPSPEKAMPAIARRSVSAQPNSSSSSSKPPTPGFTIHEGQSLQSLREESLHDQCMGLLRDLDAIVADFGTLLAETKERRSQIPISATSRQSVESFDSEEFFDAEGGSASQLLSIHQESDDEGGKTDQDQAADDDDSESEVDDGSTVERGKMTTNEDDPAFPPTPLTLEPLPKDSARAQRTERRSFVNPPSIAPPSLIGFLRKNVGKDISTISMPIAANEPLSFLQRASEQLEYSDLLDVAAKATGPANRSRRLVYLAAFAISGLSYTRVKERASRKPFNPMLGETYELVREDRGFRFVAEKISHHPVRMACQAESQLWSFTQAPMPTQKFWGKSVELITDGRVRVILHASGDRISWNPPTTFARNILAGEKYVEPNGTMTITNETTGDHATVTFKSRGMFSGRSEDVTVQTFDSYGDELGQGLDGKWVSSLALTGAGSSHSSSVIWEVSNLAADASKRYGFTNFAASLNEFTILEKGKLPPTDSRLRPDQRLLEDDCFEEAEQTKAKLEEAQRKRRRAMEQEGKTWTPQWFEKVESPNGSFHGEEKWVLKRGEEGYWERRAKGAWDNVEHVFDID